METVHLGLGSNLGDSAALIAAAYEELGRILFSARISSLWKSRARYFEEQPDFVNAVAVGETELSPRKLLEAIHEIEARFGRDRVRETFKGPRPLDIDILLYSERLIAEPDLIVPHAGLRERKFALLPLIEVSPDLVDPASGERFDAILARLPPQGIYLMESDRYDQLYI